MSLSFTDIPGVGNLTSTVSSVAEKFIINPGKLPSITNGTSLLNGFPVAPGFQSGLSNLPLITEAKDSFDQAAASYLAGDILTAPSLETFSAFRSEAGKVVKKSDPSNTDADNRLNIIRSRAARALYKNNGKDTYTSDRGPITTMTLLKGPDYDPLQNVAGASSDVTEDVNSLVAGTFANFFLTDISYNFNEKVQVMQTFGDNEVVYYFGRQPLMITMSGLLFDSLENDWFSKFLTLYAGVLRGTELAKTFSLVKLTLPNMVIVGSISGISLNQNSNRDTDIPFSMQFIAKQVVPLPTIMPTGQAQNIVGTLVDFKANRQGVAGYKLGSGSLSGGFFDSAAKTFGDLTGAIGGLAGATGNVNSSLNSFRTNIFSPVYGVLSSITKIVKTVTGSVAGIISSFTNPLNQILRDITNVSTQAAGVALMVENSVNDVIRIPARTITNLQNTLRSLKSTAGTISRVPEDISQTFKRLYGSGLLKKNTPILSSGKARQKSKAAVLTSGAPYLPIKSNTL